MIGEDRTIPVDRAPGSIPSDQCLGHVEDRLRYAVDPWPLATITAFDDADALWSGRWPDQ
jgi:hypothetical protein